jgi:predicted site-specific integrase-resolvase
LYNWNHTGKIKSVTTQGGRYRYSRTEVLSFLQSNIENKEEFRSSFCYCRVSTSSQKEDLQRQIEFFKTQYPNHIIIKDIGSGLNFKRKGLQSLLDFAIKGNIKEVVVTHKDRLCRFGFDLIERIITQGGKGKIVVLNKKETSPQEELVGDLISIITVFSSRMYGLRSSKIKSELKSAKRI